MKIAWSMGNSFETLQWLSSLFCWKLRHKLHLTVISDVFISLFFLLHLHDMLYKLCFAIVFGLNSIKQSV